MSRPRAIDPSTQSQTPAAVWSLLGRCLSDEPAEAFRQIGRRGLWEYAAAEGCDAGLGGLLLSQARRHGAELPTSAARQLQAYSEHVAAANAYKLESIERTLARLQIAGVPFILLKGTALNLMLYEPGLRPMTDVDVLIREADAPLVDQVLANSGCRRGAELVREDFFPRFYCEREYFTPTYPPVKIDLHCRPFHVLRYARTVPAGALWTDCRDIPFGELRVRVPGPEGMLIHLAVHAACHGATQLRWLYDIKLWLDRYFGEIDFDRLGERCRRWRLVHPVQSALARTVEAFGGSDALARAIAATRGSVGPLDRLALASAPLARTSPMLHITCNALASPGIGYRLGYLGAVLLPGREHLGQLYARRHVGWQLAAHAVRAGRCISRMVHPQPV